MRGAVMVLCLVGGAVGSRIAPADDVMCAAVARRVDCGWAGISSEMCVSRGCCYAKETGEPSCFFSTTGVPIKKVHVVQSNHFDAGYTDTTTGVINKYFSEYFPTAARLGAELAENASGPQLKWMTQSYLVSLYLDCPTGYGLKCPTAAEVSTVRAAITAGWITWHAFPTNAELAATHPDMITAGFNLTHSLDATLGVPAKRVLSQRDVPGLPRSSIRLLAEANVTAYSIGGNGRCLPPNVPQAFMWRDGVAMDAGSFPDVASPPSQKEILTFWHAYGYGQVDTKGVWAPENEGLGENPESPRLELPLFDEAMVYAWQSDNAGPLSTAKAVEALWKTVQAWYPDAEVVGSTLEEFSAAVQAAGKNVTDALPVVTSDLSDSWIMGVQSDPWKEAHARAFARSRSACVADATCPQDARFFNATRQLMKNGEHTWGLHLGCMGKGWHNEGWSNAEFHKALDANDKYMNACMVSWAEQRQYGVAHPLEALGDHPMADHVRAEFARMVPSVPSPAGMSSVQTGTAVSMGWASFNVSADGSLSDLTVTATSRTWKGSFGTFLYQSLNDDVYKVWRDVYLRAGTGGEDEYGKPNVTSAISKNATYSFEAGLAAWKNATHVVVKMQIPTSLHTDYGAPETAWVSYDFSTIGKIGISLQIFNKTATRLPEAMYFKFHPEFTSDNQYFMDKLGEWTDPIDVRDGSGKGLHAVTTGVHLHSKTSSGLFFETKDAALVRWYPGLYPFAAPMVGDVSVNDGFAFVLHDNSWNTNYPYVQRIPHIIKRLRPTLSTDPISP